MTTHIPTADELRNPLPGETTRQHADRVFNAMGAHVTALEQIPKFPNGGIRASDQRRADAHRAAYDALEPLHEQLRAEDEHMTRQRRGVVPPQAGARGNGRDPLLAPSESVAAWAARRGSYTNALDDDGEVPRIGSLIRAWITGQQDHLTPSEFKALTEGTSSAGGILVPERTSTQLIDRARNESQVMKAGATTVPMDSMSLKVPRLTGSTAPAWRNEGAAIATGDMVFDSVTLTARSLAFIVKVSRELMEDSDPNVINVVQADLAAQVALEIDRVALRGTGTAPEPRGIKNTTGVTTIAHGGANGAAGTYDMVIDALQAVRANNFEPNALITSPRTMTALAKLKDSNGNYLYPPPILDDLPKLTTNQVPVNLTTGTSNDTSEVYVGDWSKLYVGMRTGPLQIQLVERYADTGEIGLLIWFRGDIAVAQPGAFAVVAGVRP